MVTMGSRTPIAGLSVLIQVLVWAIMSAARCIGHGGQLSMGQTTSSDRTSVAPRFATCMLRALCHA